MSAVMQQQTPQHAPDYEIGFRAGAHVAETYKDHQLSSAEMKFAARWYYLRSSGLFVLDRDNFVAGWLAGYQAYFDGLI